MHRYSGDSQPAGTQMPASQTVVPGHWSTVPLLATTDAGAAELATTAAKLKPLAATAELARAQAATVRMIFTSNSFQ